MSVDREAALRADAKLLEPEVSDYSQRSLYRPRNRAKRGYTVNHSQPNQACNDECD